MNPSFFFNNESRLQTSQSSCFLDWLTTLFRFYFIIVTFLECNVILYTIYSETNLECNL